jgi:hypothetical protein
MPQPGFTQIIIGKLGIFDLCEVSAGYRGRGIGSKTNGWDTLHHSFNSSH